MAWTYDHQYSGGDDKGMSTGQKATVTITVKRGTTVTYADTKHDVAAGSYSLDLTKNLLLGTNDIYVSAVTTDPNTGKEQKKQAYIQIRVVTLSLSSSYNISGGIAQVGMTLAILWRYPTRSTVPAQRPSRCTSTGSSAISIPSPRAAPPTVYSTLI